MSKLVSKVVTAHLVQATGLSFQFADNRVEPFRWDFLYAHGKLETLVKTQDLVSCRQPSPRRTGVFNGTFRDSVGTEHPVVVLWSAVPGDGGFVVLAEDKVGVAEAHKMTAFPIK